jgi:hypothetical protein
MTNSTNGNNAGDGDSANSDVQPIQPIRLQPISQKSGNWYSVWCNRYASFFGVRKSLKT